jgi:hypothetical protein
MGIAKRDDIQPADKYRPPWQAVSADFLIIPALAGFKEFFDYESSASVSTTLRTLLL